MPATLLSAKTPTYLVCPPTFYEVSYIINPWMQPAEWAAHRTTWTNKAAAQWQHLTQTMAALGWGVEEIAPADGLPDMVFAANHAFVLDGVALISHFATPERAPEEPLIAAWFAAHGFDMRQTKTVQEGAGDILYDPAKDTIYVGGGAVEELPFRTQRKIMQELEEIYHRKVIQLPLVNPYFYHLDTCFCPLLDGGAMVTPSAFAPETIHKLRDIYGERLVLVGEDDAKHFACNAVVHDRDIVMPRVGEKLTEQLHSMGFKTHQLELDAYILAGGASRCLTLKLTD